MTLVRLGLLAALSGCSFLTGVPATPEPCTLARAGTDTVSGTVQSAAGDSATFVTVGRCAP